MENGGTGTRAMHKFGKNVCTGAMKRWFFWRYQCQSPARVPGQSWTRLSDLGSEIWVQRFWFRDFGSEIWVQRFGFRDSGSEIWAQRFGFRDLGSEIWVQRFG
jgi:hypothetical protein